MDTNIKYKTPVINYNQYPQAYKIGWRYIVWSSDIPYWFVNFDNALEEFKKTIKLVPNEKVIFAKIIEVK